MSDQSHFSSSSSSSTSLALSSSFLLPRSLIAQFQLPIADKELLARCVQFLDQKDRVRLARSNHFMFEICASADSWRSEAILESLQISAESIVNSNPQCFRFHGPSVRCKPGMMRNIAKNKLFEYARCVELAWKTYKIPLEDGAEGSSSEEEGEECDHSDECESDYESEDENEEEDDESIKSTDDDATIDLDLSGHELFHLFLAEVPSYLVKNVKALPSSLKSCSIAMSEEDKVEDVIRLISLLPSSLHTLQLLLNTDKQLDFGQSLRRFEQLKQFIIQGNSGSHFVPPIIDTFGLDPKHLPSLRIHCELEGKQVIESIGQQEEYLPHSSVAIFCAALTHLQVHNFQIFDNCSPNVDWGRCFPHLHSLSVYSFHVCTDESKFGGHLLPVAIGNRVRTLNLDSVQFEVCSGVKGKIAYDPFARHGLTNLCSLTVNQSVSTGRGFFDRLVTLSRLSMITYPNWTFQEFEHLRNLQSISLLSWPRDCYLPDPKDTPLSNWQQVTKVLNGQDPEVEVHSKEGGRHEVPVESLAEIFPSLTELHLENPEGLPIDAWYLLKTIPNLRAIKWGNEPLLHPDQVLAYYTREAIAEREDRRLQQKRITYLDAKENNHEDESDSLASSEPSSPRDATTTTTGNWSNTSNHFSSIARTFNLFNLSLVFQSFTLAELARASTVSKHWRSAALDPLVLRRTIRIEMHQSQGVIVHGPQLHLRTILSMSQVCNSAVFRHLRILSLGGYKAPKLSRESHFANDYLRLLMQLTCFTSLHTLALDWSHESVHIFPTIYDLESIQSVFESPALQHLKVLRVEAPPFLIAILLQYIPKLKALEFVELTYSHDNFFYVQPNEEINPDHFARQLSLLPALKYLSIDIAKHARWGDQKPLDELHQLCNNVSPCFKEVMWRIPLSGASLSYLANQSKVFKFPYMRSIHIDRLDHSFNPLSEASVTMPDLCDVSINSVTNKGSNEFGAPRPLISSLACRLRSLKFSFAPFKPKGVFTASVLASLALSHFPQLECLHISRTFSEAESGEGNETIINQEMVKLVENCPALTELNCPSFNLGGAHHWERIVPRLHIVYSHPLVKPALLSLAKKLREYHATKAPSRQVLSLLMQLPHFERVSFTTEKEDGDDEDDENDTVVLERVEIAYLQTQWTKSKQQRDSVQQAVSSTLTSDDVAKSNHQINP